jgi:flagellum-specific peptidoglycan hydrolase FlgJ
MKASKHDYITYFLLGICIVLSGYYIYLRSTKKEPIPLVNSIEIAFIIPDSTLSLKNIYSEITNRDILYPKIVLSQCILETGWLTSYNCLRRNNLFGFRSKNWSSEKNTHGYKIEDNWQSSVLYYKEWQDKNYSGGDYYAFLKRIGYATSEDYEWKLKSIEKEVDDLILEW